MPHARRARPSLTGFLVGLAVVCVGVDLALLATHEAAALPALLAAKYPLALAGALAGPRLRRCIRRAEAACLRDLEH